MAFCCPLQSTQNFFCPVLLAWSIFVFGADFDKPVVVDSILQV